MKKSELRPEATEKAIGGELRTNPAFYSGQMVKLDTFSQRIMLCRPVPVHPTLPEKGEGTETVEPVETWRPRPWRNTDTTRLVEWLQAEYYGRVAAHRVEAAVELKAERNSYSSAVERLEALPEWDGEERLDRFLVDCCGVDCSYAERSEGQREELIDYHAEVGRKLLIGIVARVMVPGCKVDTMVVLEGAQGSGKSTLARLLALDDEWFSDGLSHDLSSKDARAHLAGKLIVEMPEIGQLKRSSVEATKAFVSATEDKYRPSYGRHEITCKRQCTFIGTTNETTYLKDETGNRRFLPVQCGRIDLDQVRANVPQLYAEALHYWRAGEAWLISRKLWQVVERQQRERIVEDVWTSPVTAFVATKRRIALECGEAEVWIEIADVLTNALDIKIGLQDKAAETRVGIILAKMGAPRMRPLINGVRRWVRCLPVSSQND